MRLLVLNNYDFFFDSGPLLKKITKTHNYYNLLYFIRHNYDLAADSKKMGLIMPFLFG